MRTGVGEIAAVPHTPRPTVSTFESSPVGGCDSVSPVGLFALAQKILTAVRKLEKNHSLSALEGSKILALTGSLRFSP